MPDVEPEDEARDVLLKESRAVEILTYLEKFEYASREHVILALLWHTGIRLGSIRAFDVDDFDPTAPCIDLRHRPETGTPLKNKQAANRSIAIGPRYADVLTDHIQVNRTDVRDEHGRQPLITSEYGRLSDVHPRDGPQADPALSVGPVSARLRPRRVRGHGARAGEQMPELPVTPRHPPRVDHLAAPVGDTRGGRL